MRRVLHEGSVPKRTEEEMKTANQRVERTSRPRRAIRPLTRNVMLNNMNNKYNWDPKEYARSSSVQQKWAMELIQKLNLKGLEKILDIGCGDGKVTAELSSYLPNGHILGIDNSNEMIELAIKNHDKSKYPNLEFQAEDARDLPFEDEFDVIFSNAALHWIIDHRPVLKGIYKALKKDGRTLLQMGGKGNASDILDIVNELIISKKWNNYFQNFTFPYGFYSPEEYYEWLHQSGLFPKRVELIPKVMEQEGAEGLASWIRTTWLPYTQRLHENLRESFISEIVETYIKDYPQDENGTVYVKMVRLEVDAIKIN